MRNGILWFGHGVTDDSSKAIQISYQEHLDLPALVDLDI